MATNKKPTVQELAQKRTELEDQLRLVRQEIAARAGEVEEPTKTDTK